MAKTYLVCTTALVTYDNLVKIDEEEMEEYRKDFPDYTDEEIIKEMFYDGNCEVIDCSPQDWRDETICGLHEYENN